MHGLFNIAGGLRYHLRGLHSSERAWRPFRDALEGWLRGWQPGGPRLVIVGSSAGYCLKPEWLAGFGEVVCLDPDPLAKVLFARRLRSKAPNTRLIWSRDNFLSERVPLMQIKRFERFLAHYPRTPVLFSNILGQLGLILEENRVNVSGSLAVWKSHLARKILVNRPWASFHDRVSGPIHLDFAQPFRSPHRLSDDEILSSLYPEPESDTVLNDHDTSGLFSAERPHTYFHWQLTPKWSHLIEATHSGNGPAA